MEDRPPGRLRTGVIFVAGFGMVAAVLGASSWLLDGQPPQRLPILPVAAPYPGVKG